MGWIRCWLTMGLSVLWAALSRVTIGLDGFWLPDVILECSVAALQT